MGRIAGKPERTEEQKLNDYTVIAERYLKGHRQLDIANELGLSQQQISVDLKAIRRLWAEQAAGDWGEYMGRELNRIDVLEQTYWQAWEESKKEKTTRKQEMKVIKEGEAPMVTSGSVESEQRLGDPRYLEGIQWCITKRSELLRLTAPTGINIGVQTNVNGHTGETSTFAKLIDDPDTIALRDRVRGRLLSEG